MKTTNECMDGQRRTGSQRIALVQTKQTRRNRKPKGKTRHALATFIYAGQALKYF